MTIRRKLNLLLVFVIASLLGTGYLLYGRIDGIFSTQTTTAGEEGVGKAGAVIGGRMGEFFSITESVAASAAFVMEKMEG